jgi:GntR family transcriptional regulator
VTIDNLSDVPLYAQLKNLLKREIQQGRYTEKIPTEAELMKSFSISRNTVREAVSALVREGILQKVHGKGTFIASPAGNVWVGVLTSLTETIESMGLKPGIKLLSHGTGEEPQIASILGHEKYYSVERLRLGDGEPFAIERTYYPVDIGLKLAKYDLNEVTLYDALELEGVILDCAEQWITARIPSEVDAGLLGIPSTGSVLALERLTYGPAKEVLGYNATVFRSDKHAFYVKMYKRSGQALLG